MFKNCPLIKNSHYYYSFTLISCLSNIWCRTGCFNLKTLVELTTDICLYATKVAHFMTDFCLHDLLLNVISISQSHEERVGMLIPIASIQKENRKCTRATSPTSYYCYQFSVPLEIIIILMLKQRKSIITFPSVALLCNKLVFVHCGAFVLREVDKHTA